jgi:K+-transporting ATPase c subunit
MNYMNIQNPSKETTSNLKRANTVAFSPNQTAKTRTRSATSQSMNSLVDLFDDDIASASNTSPLNFTPLVPTTFTSTPHQTRRYTIPGNMHSGNKPVISSAAVIKEEDDDFGDFTGEETDIGNNLNAFDIFSTSMVRSKTEPTVGYNSSGSNKAKNNESLNKLNVHQSIIPVTAETSNANSTVNDSAYPQITEPLSPTQLESVSNIRQSTPASLSRTASNMNNEDDPYNRASYFRKSTPLSNNSQKDLKVRQQLNDTNPKDDPFDLFSSSNSQSSKAIPPASAQFDLLSPVYNQQQTNAKKSISAKQELFDSFMSPLPQANQVKPPEDDEDWGDWAF